MLASKRMSLYPSKGRCTCHPVTSASCRAREFRLLLLSCQPLIDASGETSEWNLMAGGIGLPCLSSQGGNGDSTPFLVSWL
jgi:hypothetical protein